LQLVAAVVVAVLLTTALVGLLVWAHWPQRAGGFHDRADDQELDHLIDEAGNVDRERVPGESGVGESPGGW
jgi:hypothetical protein